MQVGSANIAAKYALGVGIGVAAVAGDVGLLAYGTHGFEHSSGAERTAKYGADVAGIALGGTASIMTIGLIGPLSHHVAAHPVTAGMAGGFATAGVAAAILVAS